MTLPRILLSLALLVAGALGAHAQPAAKPPINNVAGPTTGAQFGSIMSSPVLGANGGTGIANTGKTITLGGNLTTSGAYNSTFIMTGASSVTFPTTGTLAITASPTFTGTVTSGATTVLKSIVETVSAVSITANVLTINLGSGATVYTTSSNANITTFTISNVPAGATAFTLVMTGNGTTYTQTWGAPVLWPNGVPPSLTTTTGQRDVITFITTNGGTDWLASITQNF